MANNLCLDEIQTYHVCIILSLALTVALACYARMQNNFSNNPQRGMKIYYACGAIKIIIGVLFFTVLNPVDCTNFVSGYGVVAIFIGILWLNRGKVLSNAVLAQSDGGPGDSSGVEPEGGTTVSEQEIV